PQVFLRRLPPPAAMAPASATPQASAAIPLPPFKKILVRDGQVFFQTDPDKEAQQVAGAIRLQAQSEDARRWGIWIEAKPPDPKSSGSLRITGSLNLEDPRLVGKADLKDWDLASFGPLLRSFTGWNLLGGRANLEVPFAYRPGGNPWFDIRGHVEDASVRAPGENGVLFTGIEGRTSIRPTGLALNQPLRFQVGQTSFQASGVIPFDGLPVSLAVSSDSLYLSTLVGDVLHLKNLKSDGVGRADLTVRGSLSDPVLQGSAELGTSHLGDWRLDSLALSAQYAHGVFQLTQVTGRLYDGILTASGQVLVGPGQEPVSLQATLEKVQAKPVAALLGLKGMEGTTDAHMELSGTLQEPQFSSNVSMDLVRTLRKTLYHYSIQNDVQLKDKKLVLSVTLNGEARLLAQFNEGPDGWEFGKLSMANGKQLIHFQGSGFFPKDVDAPMRLEIHGQDIALQDLVFFKDQFPGVRGRVGMDLVLSGTRNAPKATLEFRSRDADLGKGLTEGPLAVSLDWAGDQLTIRKLDYQNPSGRSFSIQGTLGLQSDSPMDLRVQADRMPLTLLTEI
ncbi:MAG TPA: DUF748 domain-containing protein, partial [bacterium]|nr:DUF748 domain-containing protein [bacterium]